MNLIDWGQEKGLDRLSKSQIVFEFYLSITLQDVRERLTRGWEAPDSDRRYTPYIT